MSALLSRINRRLNPDEKRLAQARFFSVVSVAVARQLRFHIKLPHLGSIHPGAVLRSCYGDQFARMLKRGGGILLKITKVLPPSCKELLCNDKKWAAKVDCEDLLCSCSALSSLLGVEELLFVAMWPLGLQIAVA